MRIDAHQHFWRLDRGDYGWLTPDLEALHRDFLPEQLAPHLVRHDIGATVLVQAAPTFAETEFLLTLQAASDFVAGVVGWVDFESPSVEAQLDRLAAHPGAVGVRPMIQDLPDPDWMLRPALGPVFAMIAERGLRVDALVHPVHLPRLLELLGRHPSLRTVVDHAAKPGIAGGAREPWAGDLAALARETRSFCKLSGLASEAGAGWDAERLRPWAEHVLACFGPERVMWGSDWPVVELAGGYEAWRQASDALLAPLDEDARAAVEGGTAARFYGLEDRRRGR